MPYETTLVEMNTAVDNWEQGEDPDTITCVCCDKVQMSASTIKELVEKVCDHYGFSTPKPIDWLVQDDYSGISTSYLVDRHNYEITKGMYEYAEFEQGNIDLWILDLYIGIRFVEVRFPTEDEFKPFPTM